MLLDTRIEVLYGWMLNLVATREKVPPDVSTFVQGRPQFGPQNRCRQRVGKCLIELVVFTLKKLIESQRMSTTEIKNDNRASTTVPKWFWIVSVVLLLWNLMGLAVFGIMMSMIGNAEAMTAANLNDEQQALINATPSWVNIAFAVAVIFGVLGCIALLLRRKFAITLFVISLLGVLAQNTYVFFMSNSVELMGVGLAPIVILIAILLIPFSMFCAGKGWLR